MSPAASLAMILGVGLGGAAGAVLRLLLDRALRAGVLIANTLGCLLLGMLYGWVSTAAPGGSLEDAPLTPLTVLLATGLLGALSTFATVSLRAAEHWIARRRLAAVGLWSTHVLCGGLAAAGGIVLVRTLLG